MRNVFIRLLGVALVVIIMTSLPVLAKTNKTWGGLAIKGFDAVAYFKEGKAVKGNKDISFDYDGAKWLFATVDHKELFIKEPSHYAPQYGGFCAFAVSQNSLADIDPAAWTVLNDKLYLNYNASISQKWNEKKDQYIKDADQHWPQLEK